MMIVKMLMMIQVLAPNVELQKGLIETHTVETVSPSSAKYDIGYKAYIWAKNGVLLRDQPSKKGKIIGYAAYGSSHLVLEKTSLPYTMTLVDSSGHTPYRTGDHVGSILAKGQWIRVQSSDGTFGYMIDHYLFDIKPSFAKPYELISLDPIRIDTLQKDTQLDGEMVSCTYRYQYTDRIKEIDNYARFGMESVSYFENYTLQDVLLIISAQVDDFDNCSLHRNWKDEIIIGYDELCQITLKQIGTTVVLSMSCACC